MNVAAISALSALAGSIVGGLTSGATTWMNLRAQARAAQRAHHLSRQEELYKDFIVAASKQYAEAVQSNEPKIHDLIDLYALISRMRIRSSPRTLACADKILDVTINTYFTPNKTVSDVHALIKTGAGVDPLKEFAEAAREELWALSRP